MLSRNRLVVGLLVGAGGCAQILDSDKQYTLIDRDSSANAGGAGAMGGAGGNECKTSDDCPPTGSACKTNECSNGFCTPRNELEGTICTPGGSHVCDGQGACVECTLAEHCVNIVEDQCTKRACVDNTCQMKLLGQDIPASPTLQTPGDCRKVVCDGLGGVKTVIDDTDTPDDGNGCTIDGCMNGSKVFTNVAMGTNCGFDSYCNEVGQCAGCLMPSHCAGAYDFCRVATCAAGICGVEYTAVNTPVPPAMQIAGNCRKELCDGAGNIVSEIDTTDVPDDGNPCTKDSCNIEGTPTHLPEPIDTTCSVGDNNRCDGLGTCRKSNGKSCSTGSECVSTFCIDDVCCENACSGICLACNVSPVTAGACTHVPFGQEDGNASMACMGAWTCDGIGVCKKDNGQACATTADCLSGFCVDGYCCANACMTQCKSCNVAGSLGTCTNVPRGTKDDTGMPICNNTQACDGNGACKLANGQPCSWDSQCASGNCRSFTDKCEP